MIGPAVRSTGPVLGSTAAISWSGDRILLRSPRGVLNLLWCWPDAVHFRFPLGSSGTNSDRCLHGGLADQTEP